MIAIPDFFQDESEDALRAQVEWQAERLGLDDGFFARLLPEDRRTFAGWRKDVDALSPVKEDVLRAWWRTVLHLLSFQNFDEQRVRTLLEQRPSTATSVESSLFSPPWTASSLKEYLESRGPDAIAEVDRWVESFRFGDPYAECRKGDPCLSTRP